MRKTRKISIIFIYVLTVLLSACSYKEFEDSLRSKINRDGDEQYINHTSVPDSSPDSDEESGDKRLFSIDDTITYTFDDQSVQYTLNQVHVLDNINDLNLDIDDFANQNPISDDGAIEETYRFVAVDITVKNINYKGYDSEEDDSILLIESLAGFKSGIEDPNGPWTFESSYFSKHPPLDRNDGQDYYHFPLPPGHEMDAVVGWFLPTDQLGEEGLYYIIGGAGDSKYYQYFELNFD